MESHDSIEIFKIIFKYIPKFLIFETSLIQNMLMGHLLQSSTASLLLLAANFSKKDEKVVVYISNNLKIYLYL